MTEQDKKELHDKMSPQSAVKVECLMQLVKLQSNGLANTLTELADMIDACGHEHDSTPIREFAKSLMDVSQSMLIGGQK